MVMQNGLTAQYPVSKEIKIPEMIFPLSNEQRISSPFAAKYFVPRLGIFSRNSIAIARKNNDALGQKISS